jgi:predicted nuclease of restriction endonuclease-like RecB superfamily
MLTGNLVKVRHARNRIIPAYIDPGDAVWLESAERLRALYREHEGRTRGELADEVRATFGHESAQLVYRGLAKLLEDRCEFETVAGQPPEQLREAVFTAATAHRRAATRTADTVAPPAAFERTPVLEQVAAGLNLTASEVDRGLFADLKSEQRLVRFKDTSGERLLQRYNVALAQAVLLKSTRVHAHVRGEPPQRYRQLFRLVKFRRLVCEVERTGPDAYALHLDGPLSLFTATQKYGLQLALFLPAVLLCRDFDLRAEVRWGAERKSKEFTVSPADRLVSDHADSGMYVPPELAMFAELFQKKVADWEIREEPEVLPLGDGFWVPDYRLVHRASGRSVLLEVLGFWRRASAEKHLARLREHAPEPFLLAVSDQLRVDDAELKGLPAGIHRFRQMPVPDEVARLAGELIGGER